MYKRKYLKYKLKYTSLKNLQGGTKGNKSINNIIKFIKDAPIETIQLELSKKLFDNETYCDQPTAEGMIGEVIISAVGKTMNVNINKTTILMPVVIKKAHTYVGTFDMKIIDNILYVYSYRDLTGEALILIYITDLWQQGLSPHLPFMIGYGTCGSDNKVIVNKIITERQGLEKKIKININRLDSEPLIYPKPNYDPNDHNYKTNFATLDDLLEYILMHEKNGTILLPNNISCDVAKLCDYLVISYLHTYTILAKHGITLLDMHTSNIFIHWLNENSYMGEKNINKVRNIIYDLGTGIYLKIETYGLVLKIGDVGASIVHPKDDVYLIGHGVDLEKTHHIVKYLTTYPSLAVYFLCYFKILLPYSIYQKTIISNILSQHPYSELVLVLDTVSFELLDKMEQPIDILKKFTKYFTDEADSSIDTLIVRQPS